MTLDYVLYELSFINLRMYGAVLPSYNSKKDKDGRGEFVNADDPANLDKIKHLTGN